MSAMEEKKISTWKERNKYKIGKKNTHESNLRSIKVQC